MVVIYFLFWLLFLIFSRAKKKMHWQCSCIQLKHQLKTNRVGGSGVFIYFEFLF